MTTSRFRANLPALLLLTAVTSLAYNRAVLERSRTEARRTHVQQLAVLQQLLGATTSSAAPLSADERKRLARRCEALQLQPARLGFRPEDLPDDEERAALARARRAQETSWAEALFGGGESLVRARAAMGRAMDEIRSAVSGVRPASASASATSTTSRGGVGEESSDDAEKELEWIRALEEESAPAVQATEARPEPNTRPHENVARAAVAAAAAAATTAAPQRGGDEAKGKGWTMEWNVFGFGSGKQTLVPASAPPRREQERETANDKKEKRPAGTNTIAGKRVYL
ncbi:hypothetical protein FA10DRAFT_277778 [Acaromyces ingoldii]|uniref:Uncharacterized protein n=1 Tax=Acaromyces ingoldii TaxID=215250 RepID=A0A316YXB2_9BASI|nr:hypothetical protein FA10DRAFT_277778 [Acaromyces ingoldii]PWN94160.1 hypothetical protein FA10DRAFT_277778 [Acaromyces ingoldii]